MKQGEWAKKQLKGFELQGKILGLILTLTISILYYVDLADIIQQEFSFNPIATLFLSFFIIFSLTFITTRIVIALIDQILGIRKAHLFNQLLGFVFGFLKGLIIITMVLWLFELLPYQKWTDTLYENSTIARTVRYVRDKNVEYFGWNESINEGMAHIRTLIAKDRPNQDTEE